MRWLCPALSCACLAALVGCTAIPGSESAVANVSTDSRQRRDQIVRDFEQRRDEANYQAALNRYRADDWEGCEEALASLLSRTPDHRQAGLLWVELQLNQSDSRAAAEVAERLAQAYPDDAEVQDAVHRVAAARDAAGATDSAECTDGAGCSDESTAASRETVAADLLVQAEAYMQAGDNRRATELVRQAQAAAPDDPQVTISATVAALRCGQTSLSAALAEEGVRRFPDCAGLHRALGHSYFRGGNLKASQVSLRQALSLDSRSGLTYFLMGQTLEKMGRREEAKRCLAQAQQLDPRLAAARR